MEHLQRVRLEESLRALIRQNVAGYDAASGDAVKMQKTVRYLSWFIARISWPSTKEAKKRIYKKAAARKQSFEEDISNLILIQNVSHLSKEARDEA